MTLSAYVKHRLGDQDTAWSLVRANFERSFTAPSLAAFWRYWNPVYGYYLARLVYRPARRILPGWACVLVTFAFSGFFLHDVLTWPIVTAKRQALFLPSTMTWFLLVAFGILLSEGLGWRLHRLSHRWRVAVHVGFLAGTYVAADLLSMIRLFGWGA